MKNKKLNTNYLDWLAGLIDGDGYLGITKQGYVNFEISVESKNIRCLTNIKKVFGGSIKPGRGNWDKYRLHHKEGIINLINGINGRLRNPIRILQLDKICKQYNINLKETKELNYSSAWLSGFLDAVGSINLSTSSEDILISAPHKNKYLLDLIANMYGGVVIIEGKADTFKWIISKKDEVLGVLDYFKIHPLMSKKQVRINLIESIYEGFRIGTKLELVQQKKWDELIQKWNNYD